MESVSIPGLTAYKLLRPYKFLLYFILLLNYNSTGAQVSDTLAKLVQNKVANLLQVPFQNNMDFGYGPYERMRNTLNIQPVIPIKLSSKLNIITRVIVPIVSRPDIGQEKLSYFGLGDINPSFFFSPIHPGKLVWGIGPSFLLPTATLPELGLGKWAVGPGFIILVQPGRTTVGAYTVNVFSFSGDENQRVNLMNFNPYLSYTFPSKFYLTSSPIITINWKGSEGNKALVPVGGGIGKTVKIDQQFMSFSIQYYVYVVKSKQLNGPDGQLRLQWALLFPNKRNK